MKLIIGMSFLIFHLALGEKQGVLNILNGVNAVLGEFPYMAALRRFDENIYCGAVLISEQHVLTAAHCAAMTPVDNITVLLGTNDLLNGGEYFAVNKITTSDDYTAENIAIGVAVLKLARNVTGLSYASKVALAKDNPPCEEVATLTGYVYQIKDPEAGSMSQILQKLPVTIVNQDKCAKKLQQFTDLKAEQLCGYTAPNYGPCYGDAGSPLVLDNKLIGLALSVFPDCAEGYPDVYARITSYSTFIYEAISQ